MEKFSAGSKTALLERSFFFENGLYRLFGVLHLAKRRAFQSDNARALVICNPFAEESIISHRAIVNLARCIADNGWHCFRFDYMGEGDSEGDFEDSTVGTRLSDVKAAVYFAGDHLGTKHVGLLGIRFGATLSALINSGGATTNPLILISPIVNGLSYLEQLLRSNISFQMTAYRGVKRNRKELMEDLKTGKRVNVDGYLLTDRLYKEMEGIDLELIDFSPGPKICILEVLRQPNQNISKGVLKISEKFQSSGLHCDAEGVVDSPFWTDGRIYQPRAENVEKVLVSWLKRTFP